MANSSIPKPGPSRSWPFCPLLAAAPGGETPGHFDREWPLLAISSAGGRPWPLLAILSAYGRATPGHFDREWPSMAAPGHFVGQAWPRGRGGENFQNFDANAGCRVVFGTRVEHFGLGGQFFDSQAWPNAKFAILRWPILRFPSLAQC